MYKTLDKKGISSLAPPDYIKLYVYSNERRIYLNPPPTCKSDYCVLTMGIQYKKSLVGNKGDQSGLNPQRAVMLSRVSLILATRPQPGMATEK